MATAFQRLVTFGVAVLASAFLASSCSSASSGESGVSGTSGAGPAFLGLMTSSMFVTIENRAGGPLLDVRLAIKPIGGVTEFTKLISRMEAGEKRNISLRDFGGRDGTPFNLRVVRPKEVSVTAVDLMSKKYAMTVPWTQ
jgi:hypothetical protein